MLKSWHNHEALSNSIFCLFPLIPTQNWTDAKFFANFQSLLMQKLALILRVISMLAEKQILLIWRSIMTPQESIMEKKIYFLPSSIKN